jgi:hypothetical protein
MTFFAAEAFTGFFRVVNAALVQREQLAAPSAGVTNPFTNVSAHSVSIFLFFCLFDALKYNVLFNLVSCSFNAKP